MANKIKGFWFGANGCEYMAFEGGTNVFEFDCGAFPSPPNRIFSIKERIDTYQKFKEVINNRHKTVKLEIRMIDVQY